MFPGFTALHAIEFDRLNDFLAQVVAVGFGHDRNRTEKWKRFSILCPNRDGGCYTLLNRESQITEQDTNPVATALVAAQRSLELADEYPLYLDVWDYVQAYWLLGAAQRVNGNIEESDRNLTEAINRCRAISLVEMEVNILLELARLRLATEKRDEALRLAEEALEITERCGYVLQGADVHLFLAQLALADGDREKALSHAREARRLATCDGPPDYTYKVAYEEAGVLLEELEKDI